MLSSLSGLIDAVDRSSAIAISGGSSRSCSGPACVHACVCACVRACVRACARACMSRDMRGMSNCSCAVR